MNNSAESKTYYRSRAAVFRKTNEKFGGLSNMASGYPLMINGVKILSSEALYQACRFPHLPDIQRLIVGQCSPMTAKMKSKPYRKQSRHDWDNIATDIMRWCLRVKLAQNWKKFSVLLLSTDDLDIVEESTKSGFWGAKPIDNEKLVGGNMLGRLLMELREELRGQAKESLMRVTPPDIPNFLLFGKPIGVIEANEIAKEASSMFNAKGFWQGALKLSENRESEDILDGTVKATPLSHSETSQLGIPKDCKRLAEVDFPIAKVGQHSLSEKAMRIGTPHQLHLWWAWRPLAACRAMLLGLLMPDPCDPLCPEDFKVHARSLLPKVQGTVGPKDEDLRHELLKFIGNFANWNLSSVPTYLEVSRGLVKAAHPEETPLVVDPFAGGGSIPLEALRLSCETFASDLNSVACLILKVKLEDIPRSGVELVEKLEHFGVQIKKSAEKHLADFYPLDPDGAQPISYIWARTIQCESPNCGAEIPLMRGCWLSTKQGRTRALRYEVIRPAGMPPYVKFEIFEPKSDNESPNGTVTRAKATCLCCKSVLPPERVRAQLAAQRGGADVIFDKEGQRIGGARLLAVVMLKSGEQGRQYRLPTVHDYDAVWKSKKRLKQILDEWERSGREGLCPVPDEPTPAGGGSGAGRAFSVQKYGMMTFGDLFTVRQKVALAELIRLSQELSTGIERELIALSISKLAERNNSICDWMMDVECPGHLYTQQVIPPAWDFAEAVPICNSSGSFGLVIENTVTNVRACYVGSKNGDVHELDACELALPDESCTVFFTDPPYYDAVPYSDLSDFFFVWLKRTLPNHPLLRDPFDSLNPLTPKIREAVQDEVKIENGHPKNRVFFEKTMTRAFEEGRRVLRNDGVGCVVFAHKTTEGWEALLSGMIYGGWIITASWPIATERSARRRARNSAALATSVHLVCRPRPEDAPVGDWGDVLRELPNRVGDWMERLQSEHIRGADLVFACIGPALEIFSRYSKVETAEGREVKLSEYLEKVWEVVGRTALEQILGTAEAKARNGAAGALEEDARLTALFLWTLQSTNGENGAPPPRPSPARGEGEIPEEGDEEMEDADEAPKGKPKGFGLPFDVVRRFAQPLGIHLSEWEDRLIKTEKGTVHLLSISERAKLLFGEEGAGVMADRLEKDPSSAQLSLFENVEEIAVPDLKVRGRKRKKGADISEESLKPRREATTLDRVHAAMILQASGRANALRALLKAEQGRSPDFLRLANALSALYPKDSEEKRLLDAMLLAVPR